MTQKVQKWGNSLAVRIPKTFALQLELSEGTPFSLVVEGETLVLSKATSKPRYSLDELMAQVTDENIHPETDWGAPVGRERFWEEDSQK